MKESFWRVSNATSTSITFKVEAFSLEKSSSINSVVQDQPEKDLVLQSASTFLGFPDEAGENVIRDEVLINYH